MSRLFLTLGALVVVTTACATGPVSYDVTAVAPQVATDSLRTLTAIRARRMGFNVYLPEDALKRMNALQIGLTIQEDFLFVDRPASCGSWLTHSPFCKQVDFLILTLPVIAGERVVRVSAGTDRHANPFSDWELREASTEIRAAADSMAGAFGTVKVLTGP